MKPLALWMTCLTLLLAMPAAAQEAAQEAADGTLNAVAYKPLPAGASLSVRPLDNSDDNMVLADDFKRALRAKGFAVTDNAALVLTFETRDEVGAWQNGGRRHIVELTGSNATGSQENTKARVNLYDSATGGLFNKGSAQETEIVTRTSYRMDVTIDERKGGKRLWQAWATADLGAYEALPLLRAMVSPVTKAIGETVKRQPFALD